MTSNQPFNSTYSDDNYELQLDQKITEFKRRLSDFGLSLIHI